MGVRVSAEEFNGRILRGDEAGESPDVDGDNADWDTGGTIPPGGDGEAAGRWEPVTSAPSTATGPILIVDSPSTPLVFADLVQNDAQDDLVYADVAGGDLVWDGTDLVMAFVETP
jgi:hypothetical protein